MGRLLESIDCDYLDIEIVICEDNSPNRAKVREIVAGFARTSGYLTHYHENAINLGYDGNLRRLVERAAGKYIMFMGDDDLFVPGALIRYVEFLKKNSDKPYVLRSYLINHPDGRIEYFRYLAKSTPLKRGESTVAWLFKRSVTICGFTISRDEAIKYSTKDLDGTLLYQVYLMSQVCLQNDSVYCDIPIVNAAQTFKNNTSMFGSSMAEKSRYTPGCISHDNSINFTKAYFEVATYLDKQHGTTLAIKVQIDLSKFSYPFLSIQRKQGIFSFLRYSKRLEKEVEFGCTYYFYIYKWALVFLGEYICDRIISGIKRVVGHTPNF